MDVRPDDIIRVIPKWNECAESVRSKVYFRPKPPIDHIHFDIANSIAAEKVLSSAPAF